MLVQNQWIQPGKGTSPGEWRQPISDSCFVSSDPRHHVYAHPGPGLPASAAAAQLQAGPASTAYQAVSRSNSLAETLRQKEITVGKASAASFWAHGE